MGSPSSRLLLPAPPMIRRTPADGHRRDPPPIPRALRGRRTHRGALGLTARRRPQPAVRARRHGAVQAVLPGPGDPALRPCDQHPEVCAHPRHRGRRQDHPSRHLLRDVRQLLLRRLLQGGGDRARVGPAHQAGRRRRLRPGRVAPLPLGPGGRRGGDRLLDEGHRSAPRPHRPARQQGELLVDGRPGTGRPVLGDPL